MTGAADTLVKSTLAEYGALVRAWLPDCLPKGEPSRYLYDLLPDYPGRGGKMMRPYVVDSVADKHGTVVKQASPDVWKTPVQPGTAGELKDMMGKVVNEGTGSKAKTSKVQIAAKTGTAEVTGRGPNAWFVGFAPADNPRYAIAVVIEDSDAGGGIAGPVMKETLLSALGL